MKQTLSLDGSTDALGFDPWWSDSPVVVTGTVPSYPTMDSWRMELWATSHDRLDDSAAEPLATAVGSVASGTMTVGFIPSQVAASTLGLNAAVGTNPFWLVIGGVDTSGNKVVLRAGTIEINPSPFAVGGEVNSIGITVTGDWAEFTYNGNTYRFQVALVSSPPITPDGIGVDDDRLYVDSGSDIYRSEVVEVTPAPPEAVEGELVVVDDVLFVLLDSVCYSIHVTQVT